MAVKFSHDEIDRMFEEALTPQPMGVNPPQGGQNALKRLLDKANGSSDTETPATPGLV